MEFSSIKNKLFQYAGWSSVILGLIPLAIFNVSLLSNFDAPFSDQYSLFILGCFLFAIISCFNKHSRSLGKWGLFLGFYLTLFIFTIFFLGWLIVPFP